MSGQPKFFTRRHIVIALLLTSQSSTLGTLEACAPRFAHRFALHPDYIITRKLLYRFVGVSDGVTRDFGLEVVAAIVGMFVAFGPVPAFVVWLASRRLPSRYRIVLAGSIALAGISLLLFLNWSIMHDPFYFQHGAYGNGAAMGTKIYAGYRPLEAGHGHIVHIGSIAGRLFGQPDRLAEPARGGSVELGIDVLRGEKFAKLNGAHVALVTNATGRASDGTRTVDLLGQAPGVKLVAISAPEHGLSSNLDKKIENAVDERWEMERLRADIVRSRRPLRDCCLNLRVQYDWRRLAGASTFTPSTIATTTPSVVHAFCRRREDAGQGASCSLNVKAPR